MKLKEGIIISFLLGILSGCKFLPEVSEVRLSESSITLRVNQSRTITASVIPAEAEYESITWTSSDLSVAGVNNGTIVARKIGTAEITASTEGVTSNPCKVTVETTHVTEVSLNITSIQLTEGENTHIYVTVMPADATDRSVTWSSADSRIAEVTRDGTIFARSPGTVTITVRTTDMGMTSTCTVTVVPRTIAVTGVSLSEASISLTEGDTYQLQATVTPSNATDKEVTWSSDNASVAQVSADGIITAKSAGTANITVKTTDQGKTATCKVIVQAKTIPVTGVSIEEYSFSIQQGEYYQLHVTVTPSNATNQSLTWSSNNTSVVTVDSNGRIYAKAEGGVTITCKTVDGGHQDDCYIVVTKKQIPISYISLDNLNIKVGEQETLIPAITPSNTTETPRWYSSNTSVATVNSKGVVTAVSAGTATITCSNSDGSVKATSTVTVTSSTVAVTGVSLNISSFGLTAGTSYTLTATVLPSNATNKGVTWSSSNTSVATVSSSGVVTAKAAGTATITVKTNDGGKTASCTVSVTAASIAVTDFYLDKASVLLNVGGTTTLKATIVPSNATNTGVTWTSSNTSVATVSSSGVVTAKAEGNAVITAKTNDGGFTAKCSVAVTAATVSVTGVSLDATAVYLPLGISKTLTATVLPTNASNKSVTWGSSNTSVATVSSNGVVTAVGVGSATITCTTVDGSKKATCDFYVDPPSVSLSPSYVTYTALEPASGETNPSKCQIIADMNAPFGTWTSGSNSGKIKVNNIDRVYYYFCARHIEGDQRYGIEGITKIGNLNVKFRVSDDGETLFAAILNSSGSVIVSEEVVASIDNFTNKTTKLGVSAWNMFNYNKGGTVASKLLDTGNMFTYIGASAILDYTDNSYEVAIYFEGSDCFRANIEKPVEVTTKARGSFVGSSEFGKEGSYIGLDYLIDPVDWRGRLFSRYSNNWGFYGPFDIQVDVASAECDLGGRRQSLPSNLILTQVSPGATSVKDPVTGTTVSLPSNSYGFLVLKNNNASITSDFNIFIKVWGTHGFGEIESDWVTIPVTK